MCKPTLKVFSLTIILNKTTAYLFGLLIFMIASISYGHGTDSPIVIKTVDWQTEQIGEIRSYFSKEVKIQRVEGKKCVTGALLNFYVRDSYAFDIDELVQVEVEFDLGKSSAEIILQYDKNGNPENTKRLALPQNGKHRWYRHTFMLERARFSGRHIGNEFGGSLFSTPGVFVNGDFYIAGADNAQITVCDITLKRSNTSPQPTAYGDLFLKLLDENGSQVPGRVGLYDTTGRMPQPGKEAVLFKYVDEEFTNVVILNSSSITWPVRTRKAFYIDGSYHAKLPVGRYQIVVAKGIEYRTLHKNFSIEADKKTSLTMNLSRWVNMPAKGWYSGDVHIHTSRSNNQDNLRIRLHAHAEDLNVSNLLQMGDNKAFYFQQYSWGKTAQYGDAPYTLVPGQEDPRTGERGHTIQLNINEPVRQPERYYLYHQVFDQIRQQGGVTGYAHVNDLTWGLGSLTGLALDVPFGLVDFVEVLQLGRASTSPWFDFLNLGYKLSPAAGTDFPADVVGAVRSYVQTGEEFSVQRWFDGLKAGRTFVTNGPMLEFTVNGKSMGSEVYVRSGDLLEIKATATINPEIANLERIQLFRQGEMLAEAVSKNGTNKLHLTREIRANHGSWFVLKAQAKQGDQGENIVALTAPIYVYSDGNGFCKPSEIPSIVKRMRQRLQQLLASDIDDEHWQENKMLLQRRVDEVNKKYTELVSRAEEKKCITN